MRWHEPVDTLCILSGLVYSDAVDWHVGCNESARGSQPEFSPPQPPGPTRVLTSDKRALDFWQLFMKDETMEYAILSYVVFLHL